MKLKPLGDRLVIKKIEAQEKTKSGIVLPNSAQEAPQMSEVLALGDGITSDDKTKDSIKVGDKVITSKFSGTEVKLEKEEYTIIKLNEVLAIVE